jgi:CheY-like chemotaxis protein
MAELLEISGYEITTAHNGLDAVDKLKSFTPDIIISDLLMPEMDGAAFYKYLQSDKIFKSIPFIFLTAKSDIIDLCQELSVSTDSFIIKPLRISTLNDKIEQLLAR